MLTSNSDHLQASAFFGDLEHRRDVCIALGRFDNVAQQFFSNSSQANFIRKYCPGLVPPDSPNGTRPSDHTIATVFESAYKADPWFPTRYLRILLHAVKERKVAYINCRLGDDL